MINRLELELTSTCNLSCPLCIRQVNKNSIKSNIKFRPLHEIIDQLEKFKELKYITIAGPISEPTLYPELFELIKYLNKRKIEISLFINGNTHDDLYYKKLGSIFRFVTGHIYFTICGSTQELHSKYRVGSSLERVLNNLDIVHKYSKKAILTWIIFSYNKLDYELNNFKFRKKYEMEVFNTLPVHEHYNLTTTDGIYLPDPLHSLYLNNIDRNNTNIECPAIKYKFKLIDHMGDEYPCNLFKLYGDTHCFECSKENSTFLRSHKIYNIAEPESEDSQIGLRL